MKVLITKLMALQWLMITRVTLYSLVSFGTCWLTATNSIDWSMLSTYDKMQTLIGCFVVWGGSMLAFIDQSIKKLNKGVNPVATEGSTPS